MKIKTCETGAIIFILIFSLQSISCSTIEKNFDEANWKKKIQSQDKKLLYAKNKKNGQFFNPWMPMDDASFFTVIRWKLFYKKKHYTKYEEEYLPEVIHLTKERIRAVGKKDFIVWIGHNTFLLRINNEYWITDPIFTKRAFLPARLTPPAATPEKINSLSKGSPLNIIITHNHYDHLDEESMGKLRDDAKVFAPLGLAELIGTMNKKNITEMNWWQEIDLGAGKKIVCLPAQHWSRRITQGTNTTLWAGFLLITPEFKIYIAGDSGYFKGFSEIARRYPGIDYALMPTTAYHPRWFMHYAHMNSEEAIQAFEDTKAGFFIPTQWGTFRLGDEPPGFPAIDLVRNIKRLGKNPDKYIIPDIGEIIILGEINR